MKRIKVLFIHHHGTMGGASRSLAFLIKNFPPGAIDPHIISPSGSSIELFKTVSSNIYEVRELPEIVSIAGGKLYSLRLAKTVLNLGTLSDLEEIIKKVNPDIVHLNELSLILIARVCKKLNYKVVMHARVVLSDHEPFLNRLIRKMMQRHADRVVCIDGSVQNKLKLPGSSIVYNPLHINENERVNTEAIDNGVCNVLFLANLIAYKGLFDLLSAAILLRNDPKIKFYIAGSNSRPAIFFKSALGKILDAFGIVQDNEKRMNAIIARHGLENIVYLGHVKNINDWLLKTSILVFPSHMNGPSRSVFEAGAMGIPSIISLKNKVEDVVVHNKNGLIVPEKSPEKLAEAIKSLAYDVDLRKTLGENAKTHFRKLNDPAESAANILSIYKQLLKIRE